MAKRNPSTSGQPSKDGWYPAASYDATYWEALGRFVETFATVEEVLTRTLAFYAKVSNPIARAIFSGTRTDGAMEFIRRTIAVSDPGKERKDEIEKVFIHLKLISNVRNSIVHYASFMKDEKDRVTSNVTRAHIPANVKEYRISSEILDSMSADLYKIGNHLILQRFRPHASFSERAALAPILNDAWLYKPDKPNRRAKVGKGHKRGKHPQ